MKEAAAIQKEGNMLFLQAIIVIAHMLGENATLIHRLMDSFIEETLLWSKCDRHGNGGGYDGNCTGEQLERLVKGLRALNLTRPGFIEGLEVQDEDVRRRLALELRWRGPFDPHGKPDSLSVLKAIKRAVTAAKVKMNIPMKNLWLAQGVCDESGELREGEVLIANGEIEGPVIVFKSPCPHPGDVQKLMAVAGRPSWRHLRNNIVFSVQGSRPASDEMAKGDYDGDKYYILPAVKGTLLEQIVAFAEPAAPAIYATRNPASDEALQAAAAADAASKAATAFSPGPRRGRRRRRSWCRRCASI